VKYASGNVRAQSPFGTSHQPPHTDCWYISLHKNKKKSEHARTFILMIQMRYNRNPIDCCGVSGPVRSDGGSERGCEVQRPNQRRVASCTSYMKPNNMFLNYILKGGSVGIEPEG
jgi:hypothetical protein